MPASFHPTLDCIGKEYRYYVCLGPVQLPHHRLYSWHVYHPLDLNLICQALPFLAGTHDFSAFCNVKKNARYSDYVRTIEKLDMAELEGGRLCFTLCGNHFLYKMARNLVGTLIDVGKGRIMPEALAGILSGQKRPNAGVSAPAHGLFLHEVLYEPIPNDSDLSSQ
jgi:tRNA pseudouridine38-40 synthase